MIKNKLKKAELELRVQEQQQNKHNISIITQISLIKIDILNNRYMKSIKRLNQDYKTLWRVNYDWKAKSRINKS